MLYWKVHYTYYQDPSRIDNNERTYFIASTGRLRLNAPLELNVPEGSGPDTRGAGGDNDCTSWKDPGHMKSPRDPWVTHTTPVGKTKLPIGCSLGIIARPSEIPFRRPGGWFWF